MNLVTLWVNRGQTDLDLMQAVIDSIYVIDPGAIVGQGQRHYQPTRGRLVMYIQTTEKSIAFVYTGLLNAGGVYVDQGVRYGLIPIKKWIPQGNAVECRASYVYRSDEQELCLLTPSTSHTIKRRGLGGFRKPNPDDGQDFRHPDTGADRSRSLRELADDQRVHNE